MFGVPGDERVDLDLTVWRRTEVHLCWRRGGEKVFAEPHRLSDGAWDARLYAAPRAGRTGGREEPEALISQGLSREMALATIFRAMGEAMPTVFGSTTLRPALDAQMLRPADPCRGRT